MPNAMLTAAVATVAEVAPLIEVTRGTYSGRTLAVCKRTDGTLILTREKSRTVKADAEKGTPERKETVLRPTAALADFALALDGGLFDK